MCVQDTTFDSVDMFAIHVSTVCTVCVVYGVCVCVCVCVVLVVVTDLLTVLHVCALCVCVVPQLW